MNLASELNDIAVTRAVLLQQLGSSMSNEIKTAYLSILDDLRLKILKHETIDAVRAKQIIKEIKSIVFPTLPIYDQLQELAMDERDWLIASSNTAAWAMIFRAIPPESVILEIGRNASMEGGSVKDWFNGLNSTLRFHLQNSVNQSLLQGESTQQAAARFAQVTGVRMNEAETIVRTAIADVTNAVREEVYKDNEDIIKGREFSAVMDNRTSKFICAPRDGAMWDNNGKGLNEKGKFFKYQRPPLHPRCRSVTLPILKSWDEIDPSLGWKTEIPSTTKSSMDGQISSEINFEQWLRSKDKNFVNEYLGEGRAKLFLDGRITMTDLLTKSGKTLTLQELRAKYK